MHRKIISSKKIKRMLGISKAIRVFESLYYVFGYLSVLSIDIFRGPCFSYLYSSQ